MLLFFVLHFRIVLQVMSPKGGPLGFTGSALSEVVEWLSDVLNRTFSLLSRRCPMDHPVMSPAGLPNPPNPCILFTPKAADLPARSVCLFACLPVLLRNALRTRTSVLPPCEESLDFVYLLLPRSELCLGQVYFSLLPLFGGMSLDFRVSPSVPRHSASGTSVYCLLFQRSVY
jgi:hypothetical protein